MKSMFVVSGSFVNKHVGEEYDVIVEVADEPTTENIQAYADQVMGKIKQLWAMEVATPYSDASEQKVVVHLHAAPPFAAMLVNLQIILKAQSGIVVELPWETPPDVAQLDAESREILRKLENK